jgi:hypothetical protein
MGWPHLPRIAASRSGSPARMDGVPTWAYAVTPVVGGLSVLLLWIARRPQKPFPKLSNPGSEYFPDEFDDARRLFRAKAAAAGAALHILPLEGRCWGGMCGDPGAFEGEDRLTVDVAVVTSGRKQATPGPTLLHMSGIHGVEGHAGSAIQCKWLDAVAKGDATVPPGTTVLLVHGTLQRKTRCCCCCCCCCCCWCSLLLLAAAAARCCCCSDSLLLADHQRDIRSDESIRL